jgi:hypothetical protein
MKSKNPETERIVSSIKNRIACFKEIMESARNDPRYAGHEELNERFNNSRYAFNVLSDLLSEIKEGFTR